MSRWELENLFRSFLGEENLSEEDFSIVSNFVQDACYNLNIEDIKECFIKAKEYYKNNGNLEDFQV